MNTNIKACIYARVSTSAKDGTGQTLDPQLLELREYAARNKWPLMAEFTDVISGTKAKRDGLDAMIGAVKRKEVNLVLVVKLDRLGRSLTNVIQLVEKLSENSCAIICTSQGIDTRKDSPCGKMMLGMIAVFAQFEKSLIIERTLAGLANARANGVRLGRPSVKLIPDWQPVVAKWKAEDRPGGLRGLAKTLGGVSVYKANELAKQTVEAQEWED